MNTSQKERHLNELYNDCFSEEQAVDNFIYLTNKSRGKHCSVNKIREAHRNRELGTLLKKLDPIAFNCAD